MINFKINGKQNPVSEVGRKKNKNMVKVDSFSKIKKN